MSYEEYATPAPKVGAAIASPANNEAPAVVDDAVESEAIVADPANRVEPATEYDHVANGPRSKPIQYTSVSAPKLREQGVDFESYAGIFNGASPKNILQILLPCIYDERDFVSYSEVKRYVMIQKQACFIFNEDHDPSPQFAIALDEVYAVEEDPDHLDPGSATVSPLPVTNKSPQHLKTILFKYKLNNKQAYQFTFNTENDPSLAKRFLEIVQRASKGLCGTCKLIDDKDILMKKIKT